LTHIFTEEARLLSFFFFKEKKEALHHQVSDERHPFHGKEIRYYARKYVTSGL